MTYKQTSIFDRKTIIWFSCGAASACVAKLISETTDKFEVVYCNVLSDEHPDNVRFMADVEKWIGKKVTVISSDIYQNVDEVFEKTRYMSGVFGARCTTEMKKIPRLRYANPGDINAFGFTSDEKKRAKTFEENNPELFLAWPLIKNNMTKQDCLEMIQSAGIEIPAMYKLGYKNNNCRGCVKSASPKYWNMIRKDFPDVFEKRATRSRELGVRLVLVKGERMFLDELPDSNTEDIVEDLSCGPQCGLEKSQ